MTDHIDLDELLMLAEEATPGERVLRPLMLDHLENRVVEYDVTDTFPIPNVIASGVHPNDAAVQMALVLVSPRRPARRAMRKVHSVAGLLVSSFWLCCYPGRRAAVSDEQLTLQDIQQMQDALRSLDRSCFCLVVPLRLTDAELAEAEAAYRWMGYKTCPKHGEAKLYRAALTEFP